MPLTVGGGIRGFTDAGGAHHSALDVAAEYFRSGADKVLRRRTQIPKPYNLKAIASMVAAVLCTDACCNCPTALSYLHVQLPGFICLQLHAPCAPKHRTAFRFRGKAGLPGLVRLLLSCAIQDGCSATVLW